MRHFLIFFFLTPFLFAQSLGDKIDLRLEAGMYMNDFKGTLSNKNTSTSYRGDLGYEGTNASYFGLELRTKYEYLPDMKLYYMNTKQEKDSFIDEEDKKEIARVYHHGNLSSTIDYKTIDFLLYKTFAYRGQMKTLLFWDYYSGDIEFNVGANFKSIDHSFKIMEIDDDKLETIVSYVDINSKIVSPYFGFKYYWYSWRVYGNVSALSLGEAKALDYEGGVEYRLIPNLYLGASYLHKEFQATDARDKVDFRTYGTKFSIKYRF